MSDRRKVIALVKATISVPVYEGEDVAGALLAVDMNHGIQIATPEDAQGVSLFIRDATIEGDPWAELQTETEATE